MAGVGAARVDVVAGPAPALPSVPARPDVPASPDRQRRSQGPVALAPEHRRRGAEAAEVGTLGHGLGPESSASRRVGEAARAVLGASPAGWVPLVRLGAALVSTVPGGRFDVADPDDVAILARMLAAWTSRWRRFGVEFGEVAGGSVWTARCPSRNAETSTLWVAIADRWSLARWAQRAERERPPEPAVPEPVAAAGLAAVADALAPDADRVAEGRRSVAWLRAAAVAGGAPWPPPVFWPSTGRPPRPEERPPPVTAGMTDVPGCVHGLPTWTGTRCFPAGRDGWRCRRCGRVTPVTPTVAGPRLLACRCVVGEIACLHPVGGPLAPRPAGAGRGPARGAR
ncbi:hypothetical protein SAMN05216207_104636 [Pseudonocardia ammonioxydans]|uniref:Uncharacterized protein n=1 Tax=Pseudonocardia ammonioxydans TaxID=260086 RepID=A0A1I5GFU0_PSUAM|nr:hypothetical protein [Pseudonocardia ammonioxydans]SFO34918.1 hypothetical protein SAMN05216207_104636 [Pseudonocardia ammonioxydans]